MEKIFLFWVCAGFCTGLDAQLAPMFETTIFVKDAMGHIDSVVIGYDLADIPFDTVQFHEILDNSPFDSILDCRIEIRSAEALYQYPYFGGDTYKRLITGAETSSGTPTCTLGGSCILYIQAKFQPITLYWNRAVFDPTQCRENAFFTPDKSALISDPPEAWINSGGSIIISCAAKFDSMILTLPRNLSWDGNPNHFQYVPFNSIRPVEGIGMDTVVGIALEFPFGSYYSPCRLISNAEAPIKQVEHGFSIRPNPIGDAFELSYEHPFLVQQARLFDSIGKLLWITSQIDSNKKTISFESYDLPQGIYFINLVWEDGYESVMKLIKT